jgi:group I intron endonuclease
VYIGELIKLAPPLKYWGGKSYIGSSINLGKRLANYYNLNYISTSKMSICKALIKYGYSNFTLEILEFCDCSYTISREQYYIDLCIPEYNILKIAGSSLGYKHTEDALAKLRESRFNLTEEQKAKLKDHLKVHNSSEDQIEKSRQRMIEYNKSKGETVEVLDTKTKEVSFYSSIRQAAEAIGCVHGTILLVEKAQKEGVSRLIKKRYLVKVKRTK